MLSWPLKLLLTCLVGGEDHDCQIHVPSVPQGDSTAPGRGAGDLLKFERPEQVNFFSYGSINLSLMPKSCI